MRMIIALLVALPFFLSAMASGRFVGQPPVEDDPVLRPMDGGHNDPDG